MSKAEFIKIINRIYRKNINRIELLKKENEKYSKNIIEKLERDNNNLDELELTINQIVYEDFECLIENIKIALENRNYSMEINQMLQPPEPRT